VPFQAKGLTGAQQAPAYVANLETVNFNMANKRRFKLGLSLAACLPLLSKLLIYQ
jgi:hypothetical protein